MLNEFVQTWFPVLASLIGISGGLAAFWVKNTSKREAEETVAAAKTDLSNKIEAVEKAAAENLDKNCNPMRLALDNSTRALHALIAGHGDRLMRVETVLVDIPRGTDVHKIALECANLLGEMKGIAAKVDGLKESQDRTEKNVELINETLLRGDK
jgi:hypothetical protein